MKKWITRRGLDWMNCKEWKARITASTVAVALVAGCVGAGLLMGGPDQNGENDSKMDERVQLPEHEMQITALNGGRLGLSDTDMQTLAKDETVYVIAGADGSTQKIIVSDWIKNSLGSSQIPDFTELTDVYNVKGMEEFQQDGNGMGF